MKGRILLLASLFLSALWVWAVVAFDKWGANWWGISIWLFALLLVPCFLGVAAGLRLFDADDTTPWKFLCVLLLFVVLTLGEGVFYSEPSLHQPAQSTTSSAREDHSSFFYYWHESTPSSSNHSSNSKGSGYLLLFLTLVLLFILGAIVPHFWVVGVLIGLALLWGFALKELRYASDYYW